VPVLVLGGVRVCVDAFNGDDEAADWWFGLGTAAMTASLCYVDTAEKRPTIEELGDLAWLRVFDMSDLAEFATELHEALVAANGDGRHLSGFAVRPRLEGDGKAP
jgi:hypothetical protein